MLTTTYLTIDNLKDYTAISNNLDCSQAEGWIPTVEQMHIIPILGTALDTSLKTQLEALGTLTGNNATLLTYILNASAWYTFFEMVGFVRTKTMNKGLVQQFSDNSQVTNTEDYKIYKQEILDKAMFFRNALIDYLNNNSTLFPLYRSDCDCTNDVCCDDEGNIVGYKKSYPSGIYLG